MWAIYQPVIYLKAHIRRIRGVRHIINENKRCECEIKQVWICQFDRTDAEIFGRLNRQSSPSPLHNFLF